MLGFTLPLMLILGAQSLVGILLLCPKPINQPAIGLARLSYTQVGSTVFYTVAGGLLLLLVSPVYDGVRLYYSAKEKPEAATLDLSDQEARTMLSFTLTASCLALMFFLRKLGNALGRLDSMCASEAAMLKQVKGLQSEYTRLVDSAEGKPAAAAAALAPAGAAPAADAPAAAAGGGELSSEEAAELRRLLAGAEKDKNDLQARLEAASKAQAQAESNLSAVKTQSRGVENEYDRLLAEFDELKRQLSRAGAGTGAAVVGGPAKKDE